MGHTPGGGISGVSTEESLGGQTAGAPVGFRAGDRRRGSRPLGVITTRAITRDYGVSLSYRDLRRSPELRAEGKFPRSLSPLLQVLPLRSTVEAKEAGKDLLLGVVDKSANVKESVTRGNENGAF